MNKWKTNSGQNKQLMQRHGGVKQKDYNVITIY